MPPVVDANRVDEGRREIGEVLHGDQATCLGHIASDRLGNGALIKGIRPLGGDAAESLGEVFLHDHFAGFGRLAVEQVGFATGFETQKIRDGTRIKGRVDYGQRVALFGVFYRWGEDLGGVH